MGTNVSHGRHSTLSVAAHENRLSQHDLGLHLTDDQGLAGRGRITRSRRRALFVGLSSVMRSVLMGDRQTSGLNERFDYNGGPAQVKQAPVSHAYRGKAAVGPYPCGHAFVHGSHFLTKKAETIVIFSSLSACSLCSHRRGKR